MAVKDNSTPLVEIKKLKFTYPGIDGHPPPGSTPLIDDFSLTLDPGNRCLLVGSNGAGIYLHDPTALIAVINPSLMTCMEGVVRVQTSGITRGLSLFFNKQKRFGEVTEWSDKPSVKVAVTVDAHSVVQLVMDRLMNS